MPNTDKTNLMESLKKALDFSVDQPIDKRSHPNAEEFYSDLYVPLLTQDAEFKAKLLSNLGGFFVVSAPAGRGKTSIIRYCLKSLPENTRFCLFDFKNEIEQLYDFPKDPGGRHKYIRDLIKRSLASKFLSNIDKKVRFVFDSLCDFFFEERMHKLILKWRAKYNKPSLGANLEELWEVFSTDFETATTEEQFVMDRLTCAQMISCVKKTLNIDNFLLVLDNVDRLNAGIQPVLFSVAIDIFHGGAGDSGLIVAVREKNLLRFELSSRGGGVIEVVSLVSHAKEQAKPLRLSPPTAEFVDALLERRYSFATKDLPTTGSTLRNIFDQIKPKVKARFVGERMYNLANHNLRNMLSLNFEFLSYLITLAENHTITTERNNLTIDDQDFASYLYRWMYSVPNQRHEMLIDIAARYDGKLKGALADPFECDIELVILAWLTLSPNRFVRVNDVVKDCEHIGVDRRLVTTTLNRLYDVPLDFRHVEIGDSEAPISWDDIEKRNPRVLITPLGREFVESTITKFEYLYHCLMYPNVVDTNSPEMLAPASSDASRKVNVVLSFLEKMKKVHCESIAQIKERCSNAGQDWEELYRDRYCIKRQLILERIVYSHYSHIKETVHRARYRQVLESYFAEIGVAKKPSWPV